MRVYKVITKEELNACINNESLDITNLTANIGNNTFHYEEDVSYMHFFKYIESAKLFYQASKVNPNTKQYNYIAAFDIPKEVLDQYIGYGFYYGNKEKNGEEIPAAIPIPEYAIPRQLIHREYLIDARKELPIRHKKTIQYYDYYKYIKYLKTLYIKHNADRDKVVEELVDTNLDLILSSKRRVNNNTKRKRYVKK